MLNLIILLFLVWGDQNKLPGFTVIEGHAQGTTYSIKYVPRSGTLSKAEVDSIFQVIDHSLSLYQPNSLISEFNKKGRVLMDEHMKKVIQTSLQVYKESAGAFDITSASISSAWGFGPGETKKVPSATDINKAMTLTGSNNLRVKGDSLIAIKKGVHIDCNGIAQGYTVDVIANFLSSKGIDQLMVEVGGEVYVKGEHPDTKDWRIGVESVELEAGEWRPVDRVLLLQNKAVTTSGNYRNYFSRGSKTYSHIMDPHTGKPVDNGVIAVTVIADSAMEADAWDNALFVMGVDRAAKFLQNRKDLQAYIIFQEPNSRIREQSINIH